MALRHAPARDRDEACRRIRRRAAAVALAAIAWHAFATEPRSSAARSAFLKAHPCPVTGKAAGACPGYVIDHIKPLCAGGADHPSNMQWQTVAEAKVKDRAEREQCRSRTVK